MSTIFHMCDSSNLESQLKAKQVYFPSTYAADGFIHASEVPESLLEVANHFYQSAAGKWVVLKIDVAKLGCEVKYEPAAAVGVIEPIELEQCPLFPHIYGGIPEDAIVQSFAMMRSSDAFRYSLDLQT